MTKTLRELVTLLLQALQSETLFWLHCGEVGACPRGTLCLLRKVVEVSAAAPSLRISSRKMQDQGGGRGQCGLRVLALSATGVP